MKKILISIPTYNRNHYLNKLLDQISLYKKDFNITINIIDDASAIKTENKSIETNYMTHAKNHGKKKYWKTVDEFCKLIEVIPEQDYYFYLPDDFELCDDFFNKAIEQWENIQDKDKICLSLFTDRERMQDKNWVEEIPIFVQFNEYHYYRSQWMDMCIISTRKFYEQLDFTIKKVSAKRWADYDAIGSGVGPQITKRLNRDFSLYHVSNSLCFEEEHESKMNPNRTQGYTIQCNRRDLTQKIHVGIASIPSREKMLQRTVESLIYQVDEIHVFLNGYNDIPQFLTNPKIVISQSQVHGDFGDAGKFFSFESCEGYMFSVDDDILYPGDYVYQMINHIENNNRKAVIGLHGVLLEKKVKNYYKDRRVVSCLRTNPSNTFVHILGTGAMAFHSSLDRIYDWNCVEYKNMADIHFGIDAQENNIPLLCVKHSGDWLMYMNPEETIFDEAKNNCEKQTELVNSIKWKINTIEEQYNKKLTETEVALKHPYGV